MAMIKNPQHKHPKKAILHSKENLIKEGKHKSSNFFAIPATNEEWKGPGGRYCSSRCSQNSQDRSSALLQGTGHQVPSPTSNPWPPLPSTKSNPRTKPHSSNRLQPPRRLGIIEDQRWIWCSTDSMNGLRAAERKGKDTLGFRFLALLGRNGRERERERAWWSPASASPCLGRRTCDILFVAVFHIMGNEFSMRETERYDNYKIFYTRITFSKSVIVFFFNFIQISHKTRING